MNPSLFEEHRMTMGEAVDLTAQSLLAYGPSHDFWSVAYSGGKDSTTLLTLTVHLIETGRVPRPKKMFVLYGDTRLELTPLHAAATAIMRELSRRDWIECRTVMAELDQRFMVYMLGRGVPPPNNNTLRWCTAQIKVEPMEGELKRLRESCPDKPLMLIGVRLGESAVRDRRIALACSRNGAECGQGWYQRDLPDAICDKLSPILHWRTCLCWDWLMESPHRDFVPKHGFPTRDIAWAYGAAEEDSTDEIDGRTGCLGCPLATRDIAVENLIVSPKWAYLAPLLRLRPIYRELREPRRRLRQPPGEKRKDGTLTSNQNRMGPITLEARLWALGEILAIQGEVNVAAIAQGRPTIDILNAEEEARIRELIAAKTFPNKWSGNEPAADELYTPSYADGTTQALLYPTINGGHHGR
jgi:DNA sulfur modification protein DndC